MFADPYLYGLVCGGVLSVPPAAARVQGIAIGPAGLASRFTCGRSPFAARLRGGAYVDELGGGGLTGSALSPPTPSSRRWALAASLGPHRTGGGTSPPPPPPPVIEHAPGAGWRLSIWPFDESHTYGVYIDRSSWLVYPPIPATLKNDCGWGGGGGGGR